MKEKSIVKLVNYAVSCSLIDAEDRVWAANLLLDAIGETAFDTELDWSIDGELDSALEELTDLAAANGILDGESVTQRDLFDTKLMGILTPRPSDVIRRFRANFEVSPQKATDEYYNLSRNTNYIRVSRVSKDLKWKTETKYGVLDITVNLSKPEKDPKAIAAALAQKAVAYPKCQLCIENEGYAGRLNHPARQNHRIIPVTIDGTTWGFQYSPYVYYNEHCILFNSQHVPMVIDKSAFRKLLDFERQFPHYFIGSNADLPIVGGSILTHEHFQGGCYTFAMQNAEIERELTFKGFENVKAGIVKWPMSVIRISSKNADELVELADKILTAWRSYTDESAFVFSHTDGTPHNTITPIARMRDGAYELDLVLRNNITTEEHPAGVYHPHEELHHIKKENIGLIEVMGLAVLPPRLKGDIQLLREALIEKKNVADDERIASHAQWVEEFLPKYDVIDESNAEDIIKHEIGLVFERVLECAGVYKRDEAGAAAFVRFAEFVGLA